MCFRSIAIKPQSQHVPVHRIVDSMIPDRPEIAEESFIESPPRYKCDLSMDASQPVKDILHAGDVHMLSEMLKDVPLSVGNIPAENELIPAENSAGIHKQPRESRKRPNVPEDSQQKVQKTLQDLAFAPQSDTYPIKDQPAVQKDNISKYSDYITAGSIKPLENRADATLPQSTMLYDPKRRVIEIEQQASIVQEPHRSVDSEAYTPMTDSFQESFRKISSTSVDSSRLD